MGITDMMTRLIVGGLLVALGGCGSGEPSTDASEAVRVGAETVASQTVSVPESFTTEQPQDLLLERWSHSCALCHVDGNAGAPRMGNAEEWAPRLAKGADVLLQHTLEGFNQMPPLGYCMACEREDFVAMIDLMTQGMSAEVNVSSGEQQTGVAQ